MAAHREEFASQGQKSAVVLSPRNIGLQMYVRVVYSKSHDHKAYNEELPDVKYAF